MCILYLYIYLYGIYRTVPQLIVKWKDCFLHVYSRRAVCHFGRKVAFGIKSTMHVGIKESPRDPGLVWLLEGWPRTSGEQPEDTSLRASHDRCSFLQEPCVRYLPRLYLDIHVRGVRLLGGGRGGSGVLAPAFSHETPPCCPLAELLCVGQAAGLRGVTPVLESGPGRRPEGQGAETVHHHELVLPESKCASEPSFSTRRQPRL